MVPDTRAETCITSPSAHRYEPAAAVDGRTVPVHDVRLMMLPPLVPGPVMPMAAEKVVCVVTACEKADDARTKRRAILLMVFMFIVLYAATRQEPSIYSGAMP